MRIMESVESPRVKRQLPDFSLFNEDCLETAKRLPEGSVGLVYADAPFFSGRRYKKRQFAFEDRWNGLDDYLAWINPRLRSFHRVLKDSGMLFIHSDWHASHYIKMLADQIFGYRHFLNEIIWKRQSCHSDARQGGRHFGRVHDTILVYSKSSNYVWNQQYAPYEKAYVEHAYRFVEKETRRRYALGDLSGPGGASNGNPKYKFLGSEKYWRYSRQRMQELRTTGRIHHVKGRVPKLKRYLDEMNGKPLQDIWSDIQPVSKSALDVGYPTQKPEQLLDRIIRTSTKRGQIVYEPFAGSAPGGAVSFKLARRWIGSDLSASACRLVINRLRVLGCEDVLLY
jgi:DNA modification methylase